MQINTKEYGTLTVDPKQKIHFKAGLYGFENYTEWALLDSDKKPFFLLQNVSKSEISFIIINPYIVVADYTLNISESDFSLIDNPVAEGLLVFTIITIHSENTITTNLAGPILINRHAGLGAQVIQQDLQWPTRHPIG